MSTYVVFDKETGKIVHTHTEASLGGEPRSRSGEDVLKFSQRVLREIAPEKLDVVKVEQDVLRQAGPDREAYVDVQGRVLMMRSTTREA